MITLQRSINASCFSYCTRALVQKPSRKGQLHIDQYGIGIMCQQIDDVPLLEKQLKSRGKTDEVRKLLSQNSDYKD